MDETYAVESNDPGENHDGVEDSNALEDNDTESNDAVAQKDAVAVALRVGDVVGPCDNYAIENDSVGEDTDAVENGDTFREAHVPQRSEGGGGG